MTQHARGELKGFLDQLKELLDEINKHPDWLPEDADLKSELSGAGQDIARYFAEAELALTVEAETSPIDPDLEARGLTGDQLGLKMTGFRGAFERFRSAGGRVKKRFFRRSLRWADVILGSLAGVIGAAEAIKEFKESVEAAVEDRDEADNLAREQ